MAVVGVRIAFSDDAERHFADVLVVERLFDQIGRVNGVGVAERLAARLQQEGVSDPAARQWDLSRIMAPQAWPVLSGGSGVTVAVLDTGIDADHEALAKKVVLSVNFSPSGTARDVYGHGTHVAGIIAATARNIPVGRLGTEDELAHAIWYLCTPGAGFTVGAVLDVNGGVWTG